MGRVLGLDLGSKTIGVALSDETETIAFPGTTIVRQPAIKRDLAAIREIVDSRNVREIVFGLPLMMDGTSGVQVEKVDTFVESLRGYVRIPIRFQDERLTTSEAERVLINADRRRDRRKQVIDSMAACLILQSYLDRKRLNEEEATDRDAADAAAVDSDDMDVDSMGAG